MQDLLNEFINILIRLTVIYVFLGVICSFIVELLSSVLHLRYRVLKKAIKKTLGEVLQKKFFDHNLIKPLGSHPSYIPLWLFPIVVKDLLKLPLVVHDQDRNDFNYAISLLNNQVKNEVDKDELVETWFKNILESASDIYRAWVRILLLVTAFILTIFFGFDTVQIINSAIPGDLSALQNPLVEWINNKPFESIVIRYFLTSLFICLGGIVAFNLLDRYAPLRDRWTKK